MKYKLKDLCSITKGATGILKADGGKYPLVALSDERRSHSEYQFDAKAVIVPLISSTGHGHASMKRVHYQEGKFALGNILCAVIPNDEKQLHPKYLHLYLQQFKDSLLVPLMKGAANVSLPMNKLADVEIKVPSLERQLEIIELEDEAAELKNELEERLVAQDVDVIKLRQAILREAMQGKLTKQDTKDGNGKDLLEKIKAEKAKSGKKEKPFPPIKSEEIPFEIPENWVWCRLGEICSKIGSGSTPKGSNYSKNGFPFFRSQNIYNEGLVYDDIKFVSEEVQKQMNGTIVLANDILLNITGGSLGRCALVPNDFKEGNVSQHVCIIRPLRVEIKYFHKIILSPYFQKFIFSSTTGAGREGLPKYNLEQFLIPIPPPAEQNRIVKKLEQFMQLCDELQYSIQQSKIENEKLLQGALRDALKKEEVEV
jgi:type I restriction enzyme, S subunit